MWIYKTPSGAQEVVRYVLTKDAATFEQIAGEAPNTLQAKEYCSNCARPLFTHKRNFQLVDNILYSDPEAAGRPALSARIDFDDPAFPHFRSNSPFPVPFCFEAFLPDDLKLSRKMSRTNIKITTYPQT